jgi:phosphate-selective porin OprO and OprP
VRGKQGRIESQSMLFRILVFALAGLAPLASTAFAGDSDIRPAVAPALSNFKVFGRVLADYAIASGDNADFDISSGELRTARVGLSGKLYGRAKFKAELSIDNGGDVALTDVYVDYNIGRQKLRIGQFKTPNSFNEQTSSKFTPTHERAAFTDAFSLNRRVGVAILESRERYSYELGIFAQNIKGEATFGGYAVAGRFTLAPELGVEGLQTHFGVSARYRKTDSDQPLLRYRQRPVSHIPGRILATERFASSDVFIGVETAAAKGRFWAAGEYALTFASCVACPGDNTLSGGYIEAGFMVNGEPRLKGARFDRPKIFSSVDEGGLGALAFALRVDTIDLENAPTSGGAYNSYTIGADWWLTARTRLGVNGYIIDADLGETTAGLDAAFAGAVLAGFSDETVRGVAFRAQFDF